MERHGHHVTSDHILERDHNRPETFVIHGDDEYFRIMTARIRSSDVMVADVSHPTANIGFEISYALSNNIPVIALYWEQKGRKIFPLLVGGQNDQLLLKGYQLNNLEEILLEAIDKVKSLSESTFAFTISKDVGKFLDWISLQKKTSRAEYIRGLLNKKMKANKDYNQITNPRG